MLVALYIHVMGLLILGSSSINGVSKVLRDWIRPRPRFLDFEEPKLH